MKGGASLHTLPAGCPVGCTASIRDPVRRVAKLVDTRLTLQEKILTALDQLSVIEHEIELAGSDAGLTARESPS